MADDGWQTMKVIVGSQSFVINVIKQKREPVARV